MRFSQLDSISELRPGEQVVATRTLSCSEGYFRDHFPQFPVMPGVLMLEAMFQASLWLTRATDEFAHSVVLLSEARNVKFAGMVRPGQTLTLSAKITKQLSSTTTLSAEARADGEMVASARLVLERFNLADRYPSRAPTDRSLRHQARAQFDALRNQGADRSAVAPSRYRWMWIDRFTDFDYGRRASAIKAVSMTEEPIDLYLPGFPVMPCSLIIEGFAQTGGVLVAACTNFERRVVLAKVSKAVFHRPAVPGDTIAYTLELESTQPEGAIVRGTSRIGDAMHAEVDLSFAYLDDRMVEGDLIGPADLIAMLRLYGLFDVVQDAGGNPLQIPARLLNAERGAVANS